MSVGIDIRANPQSGVAAVRQFTRSFEELRREVQAAGGDFGKLSAEIRQDLEEAQKAFDRFVGARAGRPFQRRLEAYGQAGRKVWDIQPDRLAPTRDASRAAYNQMVELSMGDRLPRPAPAAEPAPAAPAPPAAPVPNGQSQAPSPGGILDFLRQKGSGTPAAARGGMIGAVVSGIASGGEIGPTVGGAAGGAIGMAVAGPVGALIGTVAGSKVGGAVQGGIGDAERRMIELDPFLRQLNQSAADFGRLNQAVRDAAEGMGLTYAETQRLMQSFVSLSAETRIPQAREGARDAIGFARGFGFDPGTAVGQFGQLRFLSGGSRNASQDKQMALMIGETIAQSGMWAKADEMLSAFRDYAGRNVAQTLEMPNLDAFGRLLIAMNQTGLPGLRGTGGMEAMSGLDQALRSGGGSEAAKVAMYQALSEANPDIKDPFKIKYLQQGGLFDTGTSVGGAGDKTNLQALMDYVKGQFSDPMQRADALANLSGGAINMRQSEGLLGAYEKFGETGIGNLKTMLDQAKVGLQGLKMEAIRDLADLAVQSPQADGRFSEEALRKATEIAARGREETDGTRLLQANADIKNSIEQMASVLLPLTEASKELLAKIEQNSRPFYQDPLETARGAVTDRFEQLAGTGDYEGMSFAKRISAYRPRKVEPEPPAGMVGPIREEENYSRDTRALATAPRAPDAAPPPIELRFSSEVVVKNERGEELGRSYSNGRLRRTGPTGGFEEVAP